MKRLFLYVTPLIFSASFGQTTLLPSYNDFIDGILQNNPLAKRANNEKKYADLQLKAARGNYDPVFKRFVWAETI